MLIFSIDNVMQDAAPLSLLVLFTRYENSSQTDNQFEKETEYATAEMKMNM